MAGKAKTRFSGVLGSLAVAGLLAWVSGCSSAQQPVSSAPGQDTPAYFSPDDSGPIPVNPSSDPWNTAPLNPYEDDQLAVPNFGRTPDEVEAERQEWEHEKAEMDLSTYSDPYDQDR